MSICENSSCILLKSQIEKYELQIKELKEENSALNIRIEGLIKENSENKTENIRNSKEVFEIKENLNKRLESMDHISKLIEKYNFMSIGMNNFQVIPSLNKEKSSSSFNILNISSILSNIISEVLFYDYKSDMGIRLSNLSKTINSNKDMITFYLKDIENLRKISNFHNLHQSKKVNTSQVEYSSIEDNDQGNIFNDFLYDCIIIISKSIVELQLHTSSSSLSSSIEYNTILMKEINMINPVFNKESLVVNDEFIKETSLKIFKLTYMNKSFSSTSTVKDGKDKTRKDLLKVMSEYDYQKEDVECLLYSIFNIYFEKFIKRLNKKLNFQKILTDIPNEVEDKDKYKDKENQFCYNKVFTLLTSLLIQNDNEEKETFSNSIPNGNIKDTNKHKESLYKNIRSKFITQSYSDVNEYILSIQELVVYLINQITNDEIIINKSLIFNIKHLYYEMKRVNFNNETEVIVTSDIYSKSNRYYFPFYLCHILRNYSILTLKIFDEDRRFILNIIKNCVVMKDCSLVNLMINHVKLVDSFEIKENKYNIIGKFCFYLNFLVNLESLDLSSCEIDDMSIDILCNSIRTFKKLRVLNLSNNNILSKGGVSLSRLFKPDSSSSLTVKSLLLNGNYINKEGLIELCNSLIEYNNLEVLELNRNCIDINDLKILSSFIKSSKTLLYLDLSYQKIFNNKNLNEESDIINSFGYSLKECKSIKVLLLKDVGLNHDNIPYFFQHACKSMFEEIYLDNNKLGEVGGVLFSNIIKSNPLIRKASLKKCELNNNVFMCCVHAIESANKNFECLFIEDNLFDEKSFYLIEGSNVKGKMKY